ncbi:MAG: hypothetical protein N4Q32_05085, partial [Neisseriaceae bacterium]|nr:hypothetical protein [Neisseriaceae bacterium]
AYDIICDQMVMLGSKNDSTASFDSAPPIGSSVPPSSSHSTQTPPNAPTKKVIEEKQIDVGELDSDVPF